MIKSISAALAVAVVLPGAAVSECAEAVRGDIAVSAAWSRATIGTARPASFYVTIRNNGSIEDRLIGIETPVAEMTMLHETVTKDGMSSMPHADQIPVAAGETVSLAPGGYHGMLMDLAEELEEGTSFSVTLLFENAGSVPIDTEVLPLRAREAACAVAP